jgi:hypothetical protein
VQPQWVFDCINACIMLPTEDYLVGRYVTGFVLFIYHIEKYECHAKFCTAYTVYVGFPSVLLSSLWCML